MSPTDDDKAAQESSEKFQRWYQANSGEFNESRRSRYKTDPAYRKEVLERNRLYRQEQRDAKRDARLEAYGNKGSRSGELLTRQRPKWKDVVLVVAGKKVPCSTIGALAGHLKVSVQAIRLWEKEEVIPPASKRGPNGDRLYTVEDVEKIRALLKAKGRLPTERAKREAKNVPRQIQLSDGTKVNVPMYTIGALAHKVGKTVVTVSQMERKDYLPLTPFRGSSVKRRLYTQEMLDVVQSAFVERERSSYPRAEAWEKFRAVIEGGWTKARMYGGKAKTL